MSNRSPAEVSFYLGLATAIATFSAAAVALGLLHCSRWRERAVAVGVLLCGTLGIGAALATVARGRTSGMSNVLIGIGVVVAAACVLVQALQLIFTVRERSRPWRYVAHRSSQTQRLPVIWTGRSAADDRWGGEDAGSRAPVLMVPTAAPVVLHRQVWMTASAFVAAVALAAIVALPDLFEGFLRSRPLGRGSLTGAPSIKPLDPAIMTDARGVVTLCTGADSARTQSKAVNGFNRQFGSRGLRATLVMFSGDTTHRYVQFDRLQRARSGRCDVYDSDVIWTADLAHQGWLQDLSRYLKPRGPQFIPAMLDTVTFDGRQWGVPRYVDAGVLFYRRDRIARPPKTWQALYRTAATKRGKRLRYQGLAYEGLTVNFLEVAYAAGAEDIVTPDNRANVNQPRALSALRFMVAGFRRGVVPREIVVQAESQSLRAFEVGRADFMRNWPSAYATLRDTRTYPNLRGRVGIAALPRWNGRPPSGVLGGHNLVISRYSKNPAGALRLVDYLSAPAVIRQDAIDQAVAPVLMDLWNDRAVRRAIPAFTQLRDAIRAARARPAVPDYQAVSQAVSTNVNRALRGEISPDQALALADDQVQQVLDSAYGRSLR